MYQLLTETVVKHKEREKKVIFRMRENKLTPCRSEKLYLIHQ